MCKPRGLAKTGDVNKENYTTKLRNITALVKEESTGFLIVSKAEASMALIDRKPAVFARILNPLSAVETARRLPSLLNLTRGRA